MDLHQLGERLFDRLKSRARLTRAGETLYARAVRILAEVEAAWREAGEAHALARRSVRVGVLPTIAPYLLPRTQRLGPASTRPATAGHRTRFRGPKHSVPAERTRRSKVQLPTFTM